MGHDGGDHGHHHDHHSHDSGPAHEHRAAAPAQVAVFAITCSDTRTASDDEGGRALRTGLEQAGHTVVGQVIVRDEADALRAAIAQGLELGARAVILTGGTGISRRDVSLEVVEALFEKRLDGFGELFRMLSFAEIGPAAMLSRAAAGTYRGALLFALPGTPVLFYGEDEVRSAFTEIIRGIPADLPPMALIRHALEEMAARIFGSRFDYLRSWRAIVASDEGLRERLLRKQELTTDTALAALRERGLDEPSADMIARLAAVVLQRALDEWLAQPTEQRPLVQFIHASLDRLRATVA